MKTAEELLEEMELAFDAEEWQKAIGFADAVLAMNGQDKATQARCFRRKGLSYYELYLFNEAVENYTKAIELDPHKTDAQAPGFGEHEDRASRAQQEQVIGERRGSRVDVAPANKADDASIVRQGEKLQVEGPGGHQGHHGQDDIQGAQRFAGSGQVHVGPPENESSRAL